MEITDVTDIADFYRVQDHGRWCVGAHIQAFICVCVCVCVVSCEGSVYVCVCVCVCVVSCVVRVCVEMVVCVC